MHDNEGPHKDRTTFRCVYVRVIGMQRKRERECQKSMKQRIRGLVSLHEIPFLLAPYKRRTAIVHVVQKEMKTWEKGRWCWRTAEISLNTVVVVLFRHPATSHSSVGFFFFFFSLTFFLYLAERL